MLSTTQSEQPITQDGQASIQQPRTDLQQGAGSTQAGDVSTPQSSLTLPQEELRYEELRVGSSVIKNTTSTPPNPVAGPDYLNAAWLWLLVPLILAFLLFRPQRASRTQEIPVSEESTPPPILPEVLPDSEKAATKPAPKKKKTKKSKKK